MNCLICFRIYKNPKLLSCGHTLCLECMLNLLKNEYETAPKCPFCKSNILDINNDYMLSNLIYTILNTFDIDYQEKNIDENKINTMEKQLTEIILHNKYLNFYNNHFLNMKLTKSEYLYGVK